MTQDEGHAAERAERWSVAAVAANTWHRTNDLRHGLAGLFTRPFLSIAFVLVLAWCGVLATVVAAACLLVRPDALSAMLGTQSSNKLLVSIGIYCGVIAVGTWNVLRGISALGREFRARGQAESVLALNRRGLTPIRRQEISQPETPFFAGRGSVGYLPEIVGTATYRLGDIIRTDAMRQRFDPISFYVERVSEQVLGASSDIRDTQQLGVRLGILFTFFGLFLSLSSAGGIAGGSSVPDAQLGDAIQAIVSSLGGAFASSIAGLAAAVLLQLMGGSLRARETRVIDDLHTLAAQFQGICREAVRDDETLKLREHRDSIQRLSDDIDAGAKRVDQSVREMALVLDHPIDALRDHSRDLHTAIGTQRAAVDDLMRATATIAGLDLALAGFSGAVTQLTDRLVTEIRSGYGRDAEARLAARLDAAADRQLLLVETMARHFKWTMLFAGTTLVVVLLVASGLASALLRWIWGL